MPYKPLSKGQLGAVTLIPRNIADAVAMALADLQQNAGMDLDQFVAAEMGWTIPQMHGALDAAQIDALALAIRDAKRGSALINGDQTGFGKGRVAAALMLWATRNIADSMAGALAELQAQANMGVDQYAAARLGLTIPELHQALNAAQIDAAALALRNFERKSALINSDQTGVGKGRVVAALIQYALKQNLVPVFVTAGKSLYTDMVGRDLPAVGNAKFAPFITDNSSYFIDAQGKEHIGKRRAADGNALFEQIARTGQLPEGGQGVFTTYSQLTKDKPAGWREEAGPKRTRKGKLQAMPDGPLWRALRRIGPRAFLILDEAHLAAGPTSEVGMRLATLIPQAAGVYYSSATFAKRPDNLNLYALGTLMKRSGLSYGQLVDALRHGGLPLQQALTAMLAQSGEFVRRELEYGKDTIVEFVNASANPEREIELADAYTSFLRDLKTLSEQINKAASGMVNRENQERAEDAQVDLATMNFGSRLFNLSTQYLLSLRADAVLRKAMEALKAGGKPFVALYNTMEGPITDLAGC